MDNTEASPRHARSTAFRARHLAITTLAGLALAAAAAGPAHAAPVPVAGYAAPASVAALQPPAGTSLAAALTAAVPAALPAATTTTYATTANVNLRVGASTKHRVVVVLTKGTKVVLRSSSGSWHKITANGKTGWVSKTYVKRTAVTSASASATTTTAKNVRLATTANLFLRSSAPSGSVLATMKKGAVVTTTGLAKKVSGKTWFQLKHGTRTGWAAIAHLKHVPAVAPSATTTTAKNVRLATTANLFLRSSAPSGSVLATMKKGAVVTTTGLAKKVSGKTWFQLKHGTRTGWAAIAHLKHVPAVAPSATTTTAKNVRLETTANLFLRSSAPSGSVLATMKKGAVVTTTGLAKKVSGKTWFQLKHGTRTGWAAIAHLKHVPAVAPAPVPTPIPTPPPTAPAPEVRYSATANVNLRASAPAGPVLALIAEGGTVTATGRTATHGATTWREVTFGSTTGWVSGDYLAQYVPPGAGGVGPVPANFTVSGAGWGHGVGMSQYGAQGMAKAGLGSDDILEHYYAPARTALTTNHAASEIRVHLLSTAGSTITPSNGRLRVLNGTKVLATTGSPVQLKVSGGKVVATVAGKALAAAGTLTVQWEGTRHWAGSQATTVSVPGAASGYASGTYRHGRIEASVLGGRLNLVNQLRMNDEYLYGLSEMPSSWAPAALQAQAIAGRTYAMRNMGGLKSACACNVYDEVASQKFTGWIKENEGAGVSGAKWKAAVDATQRKAFGVPMSATVVQYNGALIDAVYFSSSGGSTRTAQSVWGSHHAYLQARPDPHSVTAASGNPNRAWSYTATQARVASAFRVADVVSVSIARNSDLTIQSATATTRSGATSTISGAAFRAALPTKSAWVGGVSAR